MSRHQWACIHQRGLPVLCLVSRLDLGIYGFTFFGKMCDNIPLCNCSVWKVFRLIKLRGKWNLSSRCLNTFGITEQGREIQVRCIFNNHYRHPESTKRWDPGIQDPEEGFRIWGRFKSQWLMRQPLGLMIHPQGLMSQPQGLMRRSQVLMRQPQELMRQPQSKWSCSLTEIKQ